MNRKFGGLIASIETVAKEDLDLVRRNGSLHYLANQDELLRLLSLAAAHCQLIDVADTEEGKTSGWGIFHKDRARVM